MSPYEKSKNWIDSMTYVLCSLSPRKFIECMMFDLEDGDKGGEDTQLEEDDTAIDFDALEEYFFWS